MARPPLPDEALRPSLDSLLEGVQIIGHDWRYQYVNETAASHGQRSVEDLLGRTMMECYPGIEQTSTFVALHQVMTKRHRKRLLNDFSFPDGTTRWFDLVIEPVPAGLCVLSIDVTEERQQAEQLRRTEERTRFALRAAEIGVWEYRADRQEVYVSETLERIAGLSRSAGPRPLDALMALVDPVDVPGVRKTLQSIVAGDESELTAEFRLRHPDAKPRWIRCHGRMMADTAGGSGLFGVALDVTRQRMLETQLRQAEKMEALGQLAGGIAHDFNNLLTQILGYCDLLLEELRDDPRRADVEEVRKAGTQASVLTKDLLLFSRKQMPELRVLDLNTIIGDAARMLRRLVGERVDLQLRLDSSLGAVRADPSHVTQVLLNLVANARDAMPDGGTLTIETRNVELDEHYVASHLAARPGHYAQLAVTDSGTGMSREVQARLFEPFFTTKEVGKGTGLGLASVHGVVKQCGGNIWVYSEPDRGTTFKIHLPRVDAVPEQAGLDGNDEAAAGTVLLVEDDASLRRLATRILSLGGFDVRAAAGGTEARRIAAGSEPVAVLITDVVMPGESGPALAEALRADRPGLPVVYMSGYTDDVVLRQGLIDGSALFVQKPFTPKALLGKVKEAMARAREENWSG